MIISFSTTLKLAASLGVPDPLQAGIKTVTRRKWNNTQARRFNNLEVWHQAWNQVPFCKNSCRIGSIKLMQFPYQEKLGDMPIADLYHEGNLWSSKSEYFDCIKSNPDDVVWVVRFIFQRDL